MSQRGQIQNDRWQGHLFKNIPECGIYFPRIASDVEFDD